MKSEPKYVLSGKGSLYFQMFTYWMTILLSLPNLLIILYVSKIHLHEASNMVSQSFYPLIAKSFPSLELASLSHDYSYTLQWSENDLSLY